VFRFAAAQDTPFVDALPGDLNLDGSVDAADYVTWRDGLGDRFTDEDYDIWRANFGGPQAVGGGLGTTTVPEPTALLLIVLAAAGIASSLARSPGGRGRHFR
jgi:hypothetical protein